MQEAEIAAALARIAASLEASGAPGADIAALIRYGLDELLEIRSLTGQLVEVTGAHNAILEALRMQLATHDAVSATAREDLHTLLIQLRELMRKQVSGLYDLERAVGGGATPAEQRRRQREEDA